MDLSDVLVVLILAFDFVVSVWNSYAAGFNLQVLHRRQGPSVLAEVASVAALVVGFVGATYVLSVVIAVAGAAGGYIPGDVATLMLAYVFIALVPLLIAFGAIITVQSIVVAYERRNFRSVALAIYNCFAIVWDSYVYISAFNTVRGVIKSGSKNSKSTVYVLIAVAAGFALLITYCAYKAGMKNAKRMLGDEARPASMPVSPSQSGRRS